MNRLLLLWFCIGLIGCATTPAVNKYAGAYNQAVTGGRSVVIIKEGDFDTMKDGIDQQLGSIGYNKVLFSSPNEEFMVLAKETGFGNALLDTDAHPRDVHSSDAHSCKIFLKYTNVGAGRIRIDLVNGSTEASTKDEVDRDIQELAELIRND